MILRRAQPHEADDLTAVAHAAKRHWGYPERWIEAWAEDLTLTPAFIRTEEVFAAVEGDALLGFYALAGAGRQSTLEHFWVHPDVMGQGVGRALFEDAVARAAARGAERLEIESDPNAEAFYVHLGARRVGVHVYPLDGQPRVLPVLVVDLAR